MISKRYILRRLKPSDLYSYYKNINDKDIGKNMRDINYPVTLKKAKYHIDELKQKNDSMPKTFDVFAIEVDGECAGIISLGNIVMNHKARIGYWLGRRFRGEGIMTCCVRDMTRYWFDRFKLRRLEGCVVSFNKASARVLEKNGYKFEGIMKKDRLKNGKYYDTYMYAKLR